MGEGDGLLVAGGPGRTCQRTAGRVAVIAAPGAAFRRTHRQGEVAPPQRTARGADDYLTKPFDVQELRLRAGRRILGLLER